jgi:signal transduction histidine kinase
MADREARDARESRYGGEDLDAIAAAWLRAEAAVLLLALDETGHVIEANRFARELLGPRLAGARLSELMPEFTELPPLAELAREPTLRPLTFVGRDERLHSLDCRVAERRAGFAVLGAVDPRGRDLLEAELLGGSQRLGDLTREVHKANAELARLGKLRDEFLGMAAHDLRTPIAAILIYVSLLGEDLAGAISEASRADLESLKTAAELMQRIVDGLLDAALVASGRFHPKRARQPLGPVVEAAVRMVAPAARRKGVRVEVTHEGAPGEVSIDAPMMQQVVINLATNAVQHSHEGSAVEVIVRAEEGGAALVVRDHGVGMAPSIAHDLFTTYARTGGNKTARERSIGLGLVVTRKIVEAHGATIEVASAQGEGATFTVRLSAE